MVPTIAIRPAHCGLQVSRGQTWKRCDCRKHLRWSHDGKQYRRSAETRSWETGRKRELEKQFEEGGKPTAVATDDRKTIARAIELFLLERRTEGVNGGVLKKYERELGRLQDFLAATFKVFSSRD